MREPDGCREQLGRLNDVCKMFGCHRHKLLGDKNFPAKQIGGKGKYYIPIVKLARYMAAM